MNHGSYENLYDVEWIWFFAKESHQNQMLSQITQNNIFQIMEDFNATRENAIHQATHNFKNEVLNNKLNKL